MWESHLSEYLNGNIYFGYVSHVLLLLDDQREAFCHSPVFISVSMCRCSATLSQVPVNVFSIPCKNCIFPFLQHQRVGANFAPLEFLSILKQI